MTTVHINIIISFQFPSNLITLCVLSGFYKVQKKTKKNNNFLVLCISGMAEVISFKFGMWSGELHCKKYLVQHRAMYMNKMFQSITHLMWLVSFLGDTLLCVLMYTDHDTCVIQHSKICVWLYSKDVRVLGCGECHLVLN